MSILPTIKWIFFGNFVCWLGTCKYAVLKNNRTLLKLRFKWIKVFTTYFTPEFLDTCLSYVKNQLQISQPRSFGEESLRSFLWNVGVDICWAGGFYHELGFTIFPWAENEFLQRPLCKNVAWEGTTGSTSGCYILQVFTLEFVTHEIMTGWLVPVRAHTQTCTHLCMHLALSPHLVSACLNPHSSRSRCLNLVLVWIDNSDSLSVWSLPPFHWYCY